MENFRLLKRIVTTKFKNKANQALDKIKSATNHRFPPRFPQLYKKNRIKVKIMSNVAVISLRKQVIKPEIYRLKQTKNRKKLRTFKNQHDCYHLN